MKYRYYYRNGDHSDAVNLESAVQFNELAVERSEGAVQFGREGDHRICVIPVVVVGRCGQFGQLLYLYSLGQM